MRLFARSARVRGIPEGIIDWMELLLLTQMEQNLCSVLRSRTTVSYFPYFQQGCMLVTLGP
jgi:hypothetical protein